MNELVRATLSSWLALNEGDRMSFATILTTLGALPTDDGSSAAGTVVVPAAERTQAMAAPRHDRERDRGVSTSWLVVDTKGIPRIDPALFGSAAYRDRVGAGGAHTNAYLAGCEGLAGFARQLRRPLFKAGTTIFRSVAARMASLGDQGYGSAWRGERGIVVDPGFSSWQTIRLPIGLERPPGSPVRIGARTFEVTLPDGLTPPAFDRAFSDALAPWCLLRFLRGAIGARRCADLDLDPRCLERLTPGRRQGRPAYAAARELVLLEPRHEAEDVAAVIEAVIARFVMARAA